MAYTAEQMRDYMRIYRRKRLKWALTELGGRCVRCGRTSGLHFDHIDPKTKLDAVTNLLHAKRTIFEAEVRKCQLLCGDDHREKSRHEPRAPQEKRHGINCYNKRGCRCDICRAAKAAAVRRQRDGGSA